MTSPLPFLWVDFPPPPLPLVPHCYSEVYSKEEGGINPPQSTPSPAALGLGDCHLPGLLAGGGGGGGVKPG
jgi:hypothetical protein